MKMKYKVVALLLVVAMMVPGFGVAADKKSNITLLGEGEYHELELAALAQCEALAANERLLDSFARDDEGEYILPDEFSGTYINDNNELVIKYVTKTGEFLNTISDIFEGEDVVNFEETDISYSELESLYDYVLTAYKGQYLTASLSFKDSRIIVAVPKGARMQYSSVDSHISIEYGNISIKQHAAVEISGGLPISHDIEGYWKATATTAICSIKGNTRYVITAGHLLNNLPPSAKILAANSELNKNEAIVNLGYYPDAGGDYALIPLNPSYHTATSKFYNGSAFQSAGTWSNGRCSLDIPNGTIIFKYGITTGLTSGYLNARTSYTTNDTNVTVYGVAQITNANSRVCAPGDSGGTMWYLNSLGTRVICGITSAGSDIKINIGNEYYYVGYYTPFYYVAQRGYAPFVQ